MWAPPFCYFRRLTLRRNEFHINPDTHTFHQNTILLFGSRIVWLISRVAVALSYADSHFVSGVTSSNPRRSENNMSLEVFLLLLLLLVLLLFVLVWKRPDYTVAFVAPTATRWLLAKLSWKKRKKKIPRRMVQFWFKIKLIKIFIAAAIKTGFCFLFPHASLRTTAKPQNETHLRTHIAQPTRPVDIK